MVFRQFDSDSQKSLDNLEHVIVSPADDIILTREDYQRAEKALESAVSKAEGPHKATLRKFCQLRLMVTVIKIYVSFCLSL